MVSLAFEKFTLSNGLQVILHEDHTLPLVAVNVWYHVGSKDEELGRTGFAHLFEHLMFEGSKHHNRSYFDPLQRVGANLNGSTDEDKTNYWENLPSNYLELALWLEADRMGFLLDALDEERFRIQRDVVKNERRQSYENRPYGMAPLLLQKTLYPLPHPYHWSTIGSPEDLDAATLEDVERFFRHFYAPSNSSLAIAGDFRRDEVEGLVGRYFGDIPPGPALSRTGRRDSGLQGQVALTMEDRVYLPRLYLVWPAPPRFDPDAAPLSLLASILGDGKSSRLYRSLVYERQIAQSVSAAYSPAEIAGDFVVTVTGAAGQPVEALREAALGEVDRLRGQPPTEEEVTRAKNRIESLYIRRLQRVGGFGGRADMLNHFNVLAGDPGLLNSDLDRFLAVGSEDIQLGARAILGARRVELAVLPERSLAASTSGVDRSVMPQPSTSPSFSPPMPQRASLSNGLDIVVVEKRDLPIVAFGLLVRGGATADPLERPGLAYLTAEMLSEGTETRSSQQIAAEFEFLGTQLATNPRREHVVLATESLVRHWPRALELVADLARYPTVPEQELARVLTEHVTELRQVQDDPAALANRVAPMLLYGRTTQYGHPLRGTEPALEGLAREEIQTHHQAVYGPTTTTLIVVGDVSAAEVLSRAEALFNDWRTEALTTQLRPGNGAESPAPRTTFFLLDKPGAAQSVIRAGHLSIPRDHPDFYALSLLDYTFGGHFSARLNQNLRQNKGYSYGYHSWIQWHRDSSMLLAGGGVQTSKTGEAIAETLREFVEIREGHPVSATELEDARSGLLRGLPESFETPQQILSHLAELVLFDLPDTYLSAFSAQMGAVSLADVQRVAHERIQADRLVVLVAGDRAVVEAQLQSLGMPLFLVDSEGNQVA